MSHPEPAAPRQVILCDESGRPTGSADLLAAHTGAGPAPPRVLRVRVQPGPAEGAAPATGGREDALAVGLGEHLLQPSAAGETPVEAGRRRLKEELGLECDLTVGPAFVYRAEDPAGRGVEYEYDILLTGTTDATPTPDPNEVAAWEWVEVDHLRRDLRARPERYAPWFHQGLPLLTE